MTTRTLIPRWPFLAFLAVAACAGNDTAGAGGADAGGASDTETDTTGSSTPTDGASAGGTSGTTGAECTADDQCGGTTPYCEAGTCVACAQAGGDAFCASRPGEGDLCDPAGGACVECLPGNDAACAGNTPICDPVAKTCRGCLGAADCGGAACAFDQGTCLDGGLVYVDGGDPNCDDNNPGSMTEPLCSVIVGPTVVPDGGTIVVLDKGGPYVDDLFVPFGKTVGVVGVGMPVLQGNMAVFDDGALYVEAMAIAQGPGNGLYCEFGDLHAARVVVDGNAGAGVRTKTCTVSLTEVVVSDNAEGGLDLGSGTKATVVNSFIVGNGSGSSPMGGIGLSLSVLDASYLTVVDNNTVDGDALQCSGGVYGSVRNSILLAFSGSAVTTMACANLDFEGNAGDVDLGASNTFVGAVDPDWFVDRAGGDYHLSADGAFVFEGAAVWREDDPPADIDGDPRPAVDGSPDFPGADVPE